jgi:ABC-type multidrug transport system fused ATPase/permease subunit
MPKSIFGKKYFRPFKQSFLRLAVIRTSLILSSADRIKLIAITTAQVILGFLDLAGVVVVGALGALAIQGIESAKPGNRVSSLLKVLQIQSLSFQTQIAFLGLFSGVLLIFKSILSIYFNRKTLYFLSYKSAEISTLLVKKVLSQNLLKLQSRTSQNILYYVSTGVKNLIVGILGTSVSIAADSATLIIILLGLFIIEPAVAVISIFLFGTIGFVLYRLLHRRAQDLGREFNKLSVESNTKILEALNSYREVVVRSRRNFYANEIHKIQDKFANVSAEIDFQPYISKYSIETFSVLSVLVLAAFEFGTKNAVHAVAILSIFLAAASRIVPSVLRVQQGVLRIRESLGSSEGTLALIDDLKDVVVKKDQINTPNFSYPDFSPKVQISSLRFKYPSPSNFSLTDINLNIMPGTSTAIVGPSGGGKTTLVDLILGVLDPIEGSILVSEMHPAQVSEKWPGAISYVPQNIVIIQGTVRENVAFGYNGSTVTDDQVWRALDLAQMRNMVSDLPLRLDTEIGEGGSRMSGGERQRIGIARAFFTKPKLLVLDEATSSLDGKTELDISNAITSFAGESTIIVIAHRLSTIQNVDQVIYLDNGKIISKGSFSFVCKEVPAFADQVKLMGMDPEFMKNASQNFAKRKM